VPPPTVGKYVAGMAEFGRRKGLKILRAILPVPVRVRLSAPVISFFRLLFFNKNDSKVKDLIF
jgi:hypothetical protein